MVKNLKDLKSGPVQVEDIGTTLLQVNTPSSQDRVQDREVKSNVKRNLFGTLPVQLNEYTINKSNPLPGINFSFHSPVKSEERIPDVVSIHDSVSSALHQLPPPGDDIAMIGNDCYEQACTEDDQWLENISASAWEGKIDGADQEMGGANATRTLRRYVIQSVLTRQQVDLQNDEAQATTTDIPRYTILSFYIITRGAFRSSREIVLELKSVVCSPTHSGKAGDNISLCLLRDDW